MSDIVLVTGIGGFIAKHVALTLLKSGFRVRGTVRSQASGDDVRATLARHGGNIENLSFQIADLGVDWGWQAAMEGCRFVQHIASPFPLEQPKDREGLVPAARQGALRVLDAAMTANAERVVMTSSMVAMMYRPHRAAEISIGEADWTDPEWEDLSAYVVSKTRAEKAAWDHMSERDRRDRLVTVNPGLVLGPSLDGRIGTSLEVVARILTGRYPALPPVAYPIIDVRDLADLHVRAMTADDAGGRRLIGAADTLSMAEMAGILAAEFPERAKTIPKRTVPGFLQRPLVYFDPALKAVLPDIGTRVRADSGYVSQLTGVSVRPAHQAVTASGHSLIEHGLAC